MKQFWTTLFCLAVAPLCQGAVITLNNQGFETGTTAGWSTAGDVTASGTTVIGSWTVGPAGAYMAVLTPNSSGGDEDEVGGSGGVDVSTLENFFGVSSGLLSNGLPPADEATNGAGIYQDFTGNAGDTVSMYWAYVATDYYSFNDPGFAVVTGPGVEQLTVLASIWSGGITVGNFGATGWHQFTYVLPASGTYRLGFGVVNTLDTALSPYLMLDNAPGTLNGQGGEIPEPGTFVLLGAGLAAFGLLRRR
jgi:hypothetical protein